MKKGNIINSEKKPQRLLSLDALRGFDMFLLAGGAALIKALSKYTDWDILNSMALHMHHKEWHGFAFWDIIFPLFLFIAGVAMPYSIGRRLERGDNKREIYLHSIKRCFYLIVLGLMYNGLFDLNWENLRFASVLGRIGLAWLFAVIIFMNTNKKEQLIWLGGILIGYWAAMMLIPVPGYGAGVLTVEGNFAGYIDRLFLPGKLLFGSMDPEGILSTIPAVATALLGVMAGHFLRSNNEKYTMLKKGLLIGIVGILLLGVGLLWDLVFPINKNLWTSSFVLFAGGWSLILLSLFYLIMDVWGFKRWAFFFMVIGLNPITIYMCNRGVLRFDSSRDFFFGGTINLFPVSAQPIFEILAYITVSWIFLYFLYKKNIFLRV